MKYLIAGGGTGGHIYPAMSIADVIMKNDRSSSIIYVGVKGKSEKDILNNLIQTTRFRIKLIRSSGLPRNLFSVKFLKFIVNLKIGIAQCFSIFISFRPDIIIGTGGFGAFPVFFTNIFFRKKSFIHEQNVYPGLANRIMVKIADRSGVSFKETLNYFPKNKAVLVGYPVRWKSRSLNKEASKSKLGFEPQKKIIFFFGGSQGARSINNALVDSLKILLEKENIGIIHSTGGYVSKEYNAYSDTITGLKNNGINGSIPGKYLVESYFSNINEIYSAADLVVSRAGAGTVVELAAMGIPSVLIPKTLVPGDHQYYNAKALSNVGGAIVIREEIISQKNEKREKIDSKKLTDAIFAVIDDELKLKEMSECANSIFIPDAVERIYTEISSLLSFQK